MTTFPKSCHLMTHKFCCLLTPDFRLSALSIGQASKQAWRKQNILLNITSNEQYFSFPGLAFLR